MNRDNLVSVCSLVQGEPDGLAFYLQALANLLGKHYENYEIVLIGNGLSAEQRRATQTVLTGVSRTRLVVLANRYDEDTVFSAALDTAIGDAVVLMDYRSDPVTPVTAMIEKVLGGTDIVLANSKSPAREPLWYKVLAKNYYRMVELLVMSPLDFDRTHFSCYSRATVNLMTRHKSKIRNLRLLRNTLGVASETLDYEHPHQPQGIPKQDLASRIFARAEEALSFSVRPLRVVAFLCLGATLVNLLYAIYVVLVRLFISDTAPGWASTGLVQSTMLGILFFSLGILAMHLNVIMQEVLRRPSYTILHEIDSGTLSEQSIRRNVVG